MDCIVHLVAKSQTWLSNFHTQSPARIYNMYAVTSNYPPGMPTLTPFICSVSYFPCTLIGFQENLKLPPESSCNLNSCMPHQPPFLVFISVQFSRSVVSDSLRPHESQHARPPCPSPTRRVHSDSHLSSQWCHPAISSSVIPFFSCPQSLPASGSFPLSQLHEVAKYWSFSFSISPSNEHPGLISFRMDWLDLLAVQGTLKSLL